MSSALVGILDLNSGNLRSVSNAIYESGFEFSLIRESAQLDNVTHLIIPGVGAFSTAIENILSADLFDALVQFHASGRPLLGICLGMQLFATIGYEGKKTKGLNLISGSVNLFEKSSEIRVPHIGWNTVHFRVAHPLFEGIKNDRDFYFVHSYYYDVNFEKNIYGETEYGHLFSSIIGDSNLVGLQFHPEKSQKNGLLLLENFCHWNGVC